MTVGVGSTVKVNVTGVPLHPFAIGVTVIVAVAGVVPALVAVNAFILPEPLAGRPIAGLLLVQLKVVPPTVPVKFTGDVDVPLQIVWLAG